MTVDAPIATQVDQMHDGAPPPQDGPMAAFGREQRQLDTVTPEGVITPGSQLPDVELLNPLGEPVGLHSALDERRAVLVLYRGTWCPYCNLTLNTYQSALVSELETLGVALIAVSPQKPDGSLTIREKHDLTFAVLSDPGNVIARAAGVLTAPGADSRAAQLELGLDLEAVNADGTTGIPMPTVMILDADATVRWIDVHPNYATRTEPAAILAALDDA